MQFVTGHVCGNVTSEILTMSLLPPPPGHTYLSLDGRLKVAIQPQPQRLHIGENLQLECGAVGRPIPRYQWHRNGVPIPNATKRKLVVRGWLLVITKGWQEPGDAIGTRGLQLNILQYT